MRIGMWRRALTALMAVGALVATGLGPVAAQEVYPIGMDDVRGIYPSTSEPLFLGGSYMWGVDFNVPNDPATSPVTVTWAWGDDLTDDYTTGVDPEVWCEGEGSATGWRCTSMPGHEYAAQGLYRIVATAHQANATDGMLEAGQAIYDLAKGGSVKGTGTVTVREGGMYDQDIPGSGPEANTTPGTVSLNAKRRAGSGTTQVALTVSVPGMTPDYWGGHGMTFTSSAPTHPLYVETLSKGSYEVFIDRVYGKVTSTNDDGSIQPEGSAYAVVHLRLAKGQPTLVRFSIWNTSAGFTYADSNNEVFPTRWALTPDEDVLLSGSFKVG